MRFRIEPEQTANPQSHIHNPQLNNRPYRSGSDLNGRQALFGIVQALDTELRRESLDKTIEIGFDGYAVGGLSVGEGKGGDV